MTLFLYSFKHAMCDGQFNIIYIFGDARQFSVNPWNDIIKHCCLISSLLCNHVTWMNILIKEIEPMTVRWKKHYIVFYLFVSNIIYHATSTIGIKWLYHIILRSTAVNVCIYPSYKYTVIILDYHNYHKELRGWYHPEGNSKSLVFKTCIPQIFHVGNWYNLFLCN